MKSSAWIAMAMLACSAPGWAQEASGPTPVHGDIVSASGTRLGDVVLTDGPSGVLVRLSATGLTPGWHAMHFHAVGDCSDAGFQKSGGHINHAGEKKPHGLLNPQGPDFGDLPNIFVAKDGSANAEVFSALVKLGPGSRRANLLDADGSALVIHVNGDDHATQPIGGAGARVGCAVIAARQ